MPDYARTIEIQRYNPFAEEYALNRVPHELRIAAARDGAGLHIGLPFLRDSATGRIIDEALLYSIKLANAPLAKGRKKSGVQTALSYLPAMRSLTAVAREERVPLRGIDDDIFGLWLAKRIADKRLKRATIVYEVKAAARWLDFINDRFGYEVHIDVESAAARAWGLTSLYDAEGNLRETSSIDSGRAHMIRTLCKEDLTLIEQASGPPPSQWSGADLVPQDRAAPSTRPWLSRNFALEGGARLTEVATGLHVSSIERIDVKDPNVEYPVVLQVSKGIDFRVILVPGNIIREAQEYVRLERAACVARARKTRGKTWVEPLELLVNGLASGKFVGDAVHPSTLQREFRDLQFQLGMTLPTPEYDEEGNARLVDRAKHCFHDLRHTFARAHFEIAMQQGGSYERAVEIVQDRLGHAKRSTTEQIYLFRDKRLAARAGDLIIKRVREWCCAR